MLVIGLIVFRKVLIIREITLLVDSDFPIKNVPSVANEYVTFEYALGF